ncbi:MAG: hypothetical protein NDJ18_04480 [candidate division Zixibacteria bacterium]|nr:hypothetical protein [candidate division Zixibacteria bacterium]
MDFLAALWAPILLSAVLVFVVSSIMHMALKYHANDIKKIPDQDAVQSALRPFKIPPGDYFLPRTDSMKDMKSPEYIEKLNKGPVIVLTVLKNGPFTMGKSLAQWFLYGLVISLFSAYIASHAVTYGPDQYLSAFRIVGAAAFMGYAFALAQSSIWYGRNWWTNIKLMIDGLVYALVTAGTFGWLWPKM